MEIRETIRKQTVETCLKLILNEISQLIILNKLFIQIICTFLESCNHFF